jgi:hypothetical protein
MKKIIVLFSLFISSQLFAVPEVPIKNAPEPNVSGQRGRGVALSSTPRSAGGSAPSVAITAIDVGVNSAVQSDNTSALATAELFDIATFCF